MLLQTASGSTGGVRVKLSVCRLVVLFVALLLLARVDAAEENLLCYRVDSLRGMVELRRGGDWKLLGADSVIYNGDMIRVHEGGSVWVSCADGGKLYVRENSHLQVSLGYLAESALLRRHTTVFHGTVFFVVARMQPVGVVARRDVRVFSPTTVLSVRSTSFLVQVEQGGGTTTTSVLNGTVQMENLRHGRSFFLSPSWTAVIDGHTDTIEPRALLPAFLDSLRVWLPESEIALQLAARDTYARRTRRILGGGRGKSVAIVPFGDRSAYTGEWALGKALARSLARSLDMLDFNLETVSIAAPVHDPFVTGKQEGIRYMVLGTIEEFDVTQHARVSVQADSYREFSVARIRLALRMYDTQHNKVVYEGEVTGEVSGPNERTNTWQHIASLPFVPGSEPFSGSLLGRAWEQAVEQAGTFLYEALSVSEPVEVGIE